MEKRTLTNFAAVLLGASMLTTAGSAAAEGLEVRVVSSVERSVPDPSEKRVIAGKNVTLWLAVREPRLGLLSAAPELIWKEGERPRKARPPEQAGAPAWSVRWSRIEVAARSLSNTDPSFHWEPVPYRDVPIPECDDAWSCPAVVRTTILGDRGGLGTMAFKVEVRRGDLVAVSPGAETLYRGGLRPEVARVTVRRDDTYLGYLTELFNTPYIWGSAGTRDSDHQAERRIGSDCADFVTYGVRRLGHQVPYTSTWELPKHARTIAACEPDEQGVYRGAAGEPIRFGEGSVREGDLLLFKGHVGALARDEEPIGVLSDSDLMIHTCWSEPTEESIAQSGYGHRPVRVLRWRSLER